MTVRTANFDVAGVRYQMRLIDIDDAQKEAAAMSVVAGKVALRSAMRALLRVLRRGLLRRLPKRRTGRLRRSIRTKVTLQAANSRVQGRITLGGGSGKNKAFYAHMLERGTGVHGPIGRSYVVKPKLKKAMRIPGLPHPVSTVKIKGIKPMRMVQRTEQQDMSAARRAFNDAFRVEVRRVTKVWKH